jgi:hypothetical protein
VLNWNNLVRSDNVITIEVIGVKSSSPVDVVPKVAEAPLIALLVEHVPWSLWSEPLSSKGIEYLSNADIWNE